MLKEYSGDGREMEREWGSKGIMKEDEMQFSWTLNGESGKKNPLVFLSRKVTMG